MRHSPTQAEYRGKGPNGKDTTDREEDETDEIEPNYGYLGGL